MQLQKKIKLKLQNKQETETTESDFDAEEYYGDGLASVLEEVGIDPQDISNRFAETW